MDIINIKDMNVGLVSLGCSKNRVDAERMLSILKNQGFNISTDIDYCDIIIINTCAFIETAKQESINEILELCKFKMSKQNKKLKLIVVTGCLAERYKEELKEQIPEIDVVVGLGGNQDIGQLILNGLNGDKKAVFPSKDNMMESGDRILTTPNYYAYLKIADGCNNRCTYCAIPMIRGKYRSVHKEVIIEEAKQLAKNGVKELNIIAQDVTFYGFDLYGELALPKLLSSLCEIEGIEWIRLLYCYPDKITDELVDVIANQEKIVKYMDIPFQHINNDILKSMNRKGDKQLILDVISKLRKKIPDIIIRSTFIVGFPGETDSQFNELLSFIREQKLQKVGCFQYSQEEDTKAALIDNQINDKVKIKRYEMLMKEQDKVVEEFNKSIKGKIVKVLVEGYDVENNVYYGRSYMEAPDIDNYIEFELDSNYKRELPKEGDFLDIKL